jgi:glycosyltransferase involved in cell wall biosynthesis
MTRKAYNDAAFLLPWSEWVRESLVNDYGIAPEKIEIMPPGINLQQWGRKTIEVKRKNEKIKILFVGGEFLRKGGDILFKVACREEFQNCEFHFVTRDFKGQPMPNTFFYDKIEANSDSLKALYSNADIFVLPTRADFSPNAIFEAMAFELPIITTNVGSLSETIHDNENGFFIPINDEQALADRLLKLINDQTLRLRLGRAGRNLIEKNYNLENNADRIVNHLIRVALENKAKIDLSTH